MGTPRDLIAVTNKVQEIIMKMLTMKKGEILEVETNISGDNKKFRIERLSEVKQNEL